MIARTQTSWIAVALTIAAAVGSACTPSPASPAAAARSASRSAPAAAPVTARGIVGTVSSDGKEWAGSGVVYLEDAPKQPGVMTRATIDVHHKEFTPFIAVITTGGTVTFGNGDNLTHHVFSPDIPSWDTGYLKKGETTAARTFDAPGAYALLCNIHPEMLGYVLVIPSTFFGKVGSDGRYTIPNVAPGTYKATLWVPRMQTISQPATVGAAGVVTLNFERPPASSTTGGPGSSHG
jgi:plastocyanin